MQEAAAAAAQTAVKTVEHAQQAAAAAANTVAEAAEAQARPAASLRACFSYVLK